MIDHLMNIYAERPGSKPEITLRGVVMSRFSLLSTLKLSLFNEVIWHNENAGDPLNVLSAPILRPRLQFSAYHQRSVVRPRWGRWKTVIVSTRFNSLSIRHQKTGGQTKLLGAKLDAHHPARGAIFRAETQYDLHWPTKWRGLSGC
ncbi:hypothetical protein HED51_23020 [Ochrobactrum grignonense]|nr:hypothetical protein [Brucella grignonensis]